MIKSINTKHFFLLFAFPVLLLGFGLLWPARPTFRLKQVHLRPAIIRPGIYRLPVKVLTVDVVTEYSDASILSRFSGDSYVAFDTQYGLYIEDEHAIRYGRSYSAKDTKTYRPFIYNNKLKRSYDIRVSGVNGNLYGTTFQIPMYQIPKSAGRLTLKTVLVLEGGSPTRPPVQLPIAVVVRE